MNDRCDRINSYKWQMFLPLLFTIHFSLFTSSCTTDAYEKGEGEYSLLRGDFVEASSNANSELVSMTTDDGDLLPFIQPYSDKWVTTADSTYRCMLYYNKVKDTQGKDAAEIVSIAPVPCPVVKPLSEFDMELRTDPVKFNSIWVSKSGKYLNLYLQLKTGSTDDASAVQKLAVVTDTLLQHSDGTLTRHLILHHDQGGVPEYYSTAAYLSIPLAAMDADSIRFSIHSYSGLVIKTLSIRQ